MSNYNEVTITQQDVSRWLAAREITFVNNYEDSGKHVTLYNVMREAVDGVLTKEESAGCVSGVFASMSDKIPYIDTNYNQLLDANGQPVDGYYFTAQDVYNMLGCVFVEVMAKHNRATRGA